MDVNHTGVLGPAPGRAAWTSVTPEPSGLQSPCAQRVPGGTSGKCVLLSYKGRPPSHSDRVWRQAVVLGLGTQPFAKLTRGRASF